MFCKYPSIENSYRSKEIQYWTEKFPELVDVKYIVQEKIHGSNISLIVKSDGSTPIIAKRSGIIGRDESFYGIQSLLNEKYVNMMEMLRQAGLVGVYLNIYGELFGRGVQKGVDYGDGKFILFFDMAVNYRFVSPHVMEEMFFGLGLKEMLVPNFGIVDGLQSALDFDIEDRKSLVYPDGNSIIEGIVIKPYDKVYCLDYSEDTPTSKIGRPFYLKKKNEKFKERVKSKRRDRAVDSKLASLQSIFSEYITENRVLNVFSKYGDIESPKQMGEYIKYILEDARIDYHKDNPGLTDGLNKKELKYVYNVSKSIVEILRKYL